MLRATQRALERRQELEAADPSLFAERAGVYPDSWQRDLLRSSAKQLILNCSRQSGKSTVSSIVALHAAVYEPGSLILLLAPSLRQSQELFRKVKDAMSVLRLEAEEESALRVEFANLSRIVCLPGDESRIRGFSGVRLLLIDEAARVPDALYYSVRPMLAVSGGRIVLLSTPFGQRGFYFKEWSEGSDWWRVKVTAADCPRLDPAWLEAERAAIGDWWYQQEYGCQFVDTVDQVFASEHIKAALDAGGAQLFEDF